MVGRGKVYDEIAAAIIDEQPWGGHEVGRQHHLLRTDSELKLLDGRCASALAENVPSLTSLRRIISRQRGPAGDRVDRAEDAALQPSTTQAAGRITSNGDSHLRRCAPRLSVDRVRLN